jgi:hypothetical protein
MPRARNENDWLELYELPAFQSGQGFDETKIFEWTEKLEKEGKLRSIDVLWLSQIIKLAFENGRKSVEND